MNTQTTAPPPKLFIGMDIHKKSWSVHLRTDLFDHKGFTMPSSTDKLYKYVEEHFPAHEVYLTYEAGPCGFWVARYFLNLGWRVKVVNPADIPRSDKQHYQKTDKLDCRNLCRQLRDNRLTAIYIPTEAQESLRSLLRHRNQVTQVLRRQKSQLKGMLLFHGVYIPDEYDNPNWSVAFMDWLKSLSWTHSTAATCMQSRLRLIETLHKEYLQIANELRAYCRKQHCKDYYLLKSIPGIGGYLAAAILAEMGDIRRFDNERQFSSAIGLVPGLHQSSDSEKTMGLTPRCKSLLRSYLIEAAWVAIRMDTEMQTYYRKHAGKNTKAVIVKVAHKMCRRILSVIKKEQPYVLNYIQKKAAA